MSRDRSINRASVSGDLPEGQVIPEIVTKNTGVPVAADEITNLPKVTDIKPAVASVDLPNYHVKITELLQKKYRISADAVPAEVQSIIDDIETFVTEMDPSRNVNPVRGSQLNRQLFNTIMRAMAVDSNILFMALDVVLHYFYLYTDACFSPRYAVRFFSQTRLSPAEGEIFQRMLYILRELSNPYTRSNKAKRLDLATITAGFPSAYTIHKANFTLYVNRLR